MIDEVQAVHPGEPAMLYRSGLSCFSGAAGLRLASLGNADTGQGYPRRGIARRKGLDQALGDVVDRGCFNRSRGPGIGPALAASLVRYPCCHRLQPKRWFRPQWS